MRENFKGGASMTVGDLVRGGISLRYATPYLVWVFANGRFVCDCELGMVENVVGVIRNVGVEGAMCDWEALEREYEEELQKGLSCW